MRTGGALVVLFVGQGQAHCLQLADDLLQGLAAQVANLHHVLLGFGDQIRDVVDVGALEAVEAAYGQVKFFDGHLKDLVAVRFRLLGHRGLAGHGLGEIREQAQVVGEDLRAEADGISCRDGRVRPDFQCQLVESVMLPTRVFSTV